MRAMATFLGAAMALFLLVLPGATPLMAQATSGCYELSFDGTNDYVSVAHNTNLNPGTSSFSVAGWFRAGSLPADNRILISKRAMGDGVGNAGFALLLNSAGNLRALADNGTALFDAVSAGTYQDNMWRHVAVTFVRSGASLTITIYVNGVSVATNTVSPGTGSLYNNTRPLTLGAGLNGSNAIQQPLNGNLDDFAYWGRALTPAEITSLATNMTTPADLNTNLRGYWPLEEGSGTTTTDAGPNSNDGTLNGPIWQSKGPVPSATLFSASPLSFCEGLSTTISFGISNGATYQWMAMPSVMGVMATFANPTSLNPGALTVTDVPDGSPITVAISVKVTGSGGCQVTSNTINVTVNPSPAVQTVMGEAAPCVGSAEVYTMDNNGSTYSWSVLPIVPGNSVVTSGNTATITWGNTTPNSYTIFVQETNANGCSTINQLSVTTKPTPIVTLLPVMGPFCPDAAVPLVNLSSTPTADSFSWTVTGDATGATAGTDNTSPFQIPGFMATNPGGMIRTSATSVTAELDGCVSAPVNFTVTVNPAPDLSLIPAPAICAGESFDLQTLFTAVNFADANMVNGVVSVHSTAPTSGLNQIVFPNTTVTPPPPSITYYYRKTSVIAGPACFDEIPVTLSVEGPVTLNSIAFANNQNTICEGTTTTIDVSATNAGSGPLVYQWQVSTDGGMNWTNIVSGNASTPYTIQLSGARLRINSAQLGQNGYKYQCLVSTAECAAQTSAVLTLNVNPVPTIAGSSVNNVTCNGGVNGLYIFQPGPGNFVYGFSAGTTYSGPVPPVTLAQPVNFLSGLAAGDYRLRLQDAVTGCFITEPFTVGQPAPITFTTAVQDVSCNGGSDGSITISATGGSGNYLYSLDGGPYQAGNIFSGLSADTYEVRVRDANDPNCVAGPEPVIVNQPAPLVLGTPIVMDLTCFEAGDGMIEPVASGGTAPYSYSWSGPNGYANSFNGTLYVNNFDAGLNGFADNGANFVDVDPMLTNGSVVNEFWSQNSANDRAITFFKSAQVNVVYWEVQLTNNTGQVITDLSIQYDFEVPWIANNTAARSARLSWEVVGSGSPVLSNIINNSTTAPTGAWLTDAQMDAFSLALRNQVTTLSGLTIAPGATFTVRVSGAIDNGGRRDMNHGVDNLTISSGNFSGKISDLAAGDYDLTVTDAKGCQTQQTIAVTQPDELTITLDAIPQICIDDNSFSVPYSALGGLTNRFQIQNDPAFNGTDAGNLDLTTAGFQVLGASPIIVSLNSVPPATGAYHMLITPRSNVNSVVCTGDPIPFVVYVPAPNSTAVPQAATICSGASAIFDVSTTELGVPSSFRWAYQVGANPVSPVTTTAFDGNGQAQISQVLTNTTTSPITATFFFRAYTYGPDGVDNMGDASSDDCRQEPSGSVVITILPEPAGSATATPIPATARICSGSMAQIDVNTTITPLSSTRYKWSSTNGGSGGSVDFGTNIEEVLNNPGTGNLTVTYTITPYTFGPNGVDDGGTGDDCLGTPITQNFTVEPVPQAVANVLTPTICSRDTAKVDVNTSLLIANTRYRWRSRQLPSGAWSNFINNVMYSTDIARALTNTTAAPLTFEFEIRPYTFGPNGSNNSGGGDDCTGTPVFVTVTVLPEPVLTPPTDIPVCSNQPLNFSLSATSSNGQNISAYNIGARSYSNPLAANWVAVSEASLPVSNETNFAYFSTDTYRNLSASTRTVTYPVTPISTDGCVGTTYNYVFRVRTEPKVEQLPDITICSGEEFCPELVGYYGDPTPPISHDPDITFNISISGAAGLTDLDGNDLNGMTCGEPACGPLTPMSLSLITAERWGNPTGAPVTVTYTITPVRGCGTAAECAGDPMSFSVTVEPEPMADFVINLNGTDYPISNNSIFTDCSESDFSVTGTTSTVPSDPAQQVWARVRIWGDVDALGFPGPVTSANSIFLHGPIGALNLGSTNLVNTTNVVKEIFVRIIPYIETTPSPDPINNPQTLNGFECGGSPINFRIRINPEAAHADRDTVVCSDEPLGLMLMPNNTAGQNIQVSEEIVFNDPSQLHNWVVPQGVTQVTIEVQGADGGSGAAKGGSGAYAVAEFAVAEGDMFNAIIGQAGKNHTGTGGGGGGSGVVNPSGPTPLVFAGGGGGGGAQALGGGGQNIGAGNATGGGGANNGGGGGGSYTGSNGSTGAGDGGQGGTSGFGVAGGDGFGNNGDGGTGTGGGGGGGNNGGGGGGGYTGGNGGIGTFGLGGFGGSSYIDVNGSNGSVTPGANGGGDGNNGFVRISWIRTLPPVQYTITSIAYDANAVQDGDGIDRSVAPNNMDIANLMNESDLLAGEEWINTSNTPQTVVYTIQPDTDTQCGGEPFTVTVTVEPTAKMALSGPGIVEDMPNMAYSLELCSSDTLMADISSPTTASQGQGELRFRLISVSIDDNNGDASITRNAVAGFPDMTVTIPPQLLLGSGNTLPIALKEVLTNTGTAPGTVTYTFLPIIVDGMTGNCPGKEVTLTVTVNPEPIFDPQPIVNVCSNAPLESVFAGFPTESDVNNLPVGNYEIVSVEVHSSLTTESGPSTGLNADVSNDRYRNLTTTNRLVTYRLLFFTDAGNCAGDTVDFTFRILPEARVDGPVEETVCSGSFLSAGFIGYFGPTAPMSHDANVGLRIEYSNPSGLTYNGSNPYAGNILSCAGPADLQQDSWINTGTTPAQITYTITPVRGCSTAFECLGAPLTFVLTVEPTPAASVDVTVGNNPVVTVDANNTPQTFEFCSGESFLATAQFAGNSQNNDAQWVRVRLTGDVSLFGFTTSPTTVFGPAGSFVFGGGPLINPTGSPQAVTVQILPYFETNPGGANPVYNASTECAGQLITFNVIVNPGPVFSDVDATLCSDAAFGEDLDPSNIGVGQMVTVDESVMLNYTGALQTWTVPEGVSSITITAMGADGGNSAGHAGGSGATAVNKFLVSPGETYTFVIGQAGSNGPAAGGGGGTGVQDNSNMLVLVAGGGGGAGLNSPGIGGAGNGVSTTGGNGGANNGGGGGGGFVGNGTAGSGGAAGGNGGFDAAGSTAPNAGGRGTGGGGSGSNLAGGGGGGYGGGNGGLGTFGAGGAGGTSFSGAPATAGAAGAGTGAHGKVLIEYTRTLPPVQYVINSINDGGLTDADGNALMAGDTGEEDILAGEAWTNSGNTAVDVVYNMSTTSSQACPGSSFDVTMTIEPTPRMELGNVSVITQYQEYALTICSGETLNVPLTSPTVPSGGINLLQYRLISVASSPEITPQMISTPVTLGNASQMVALTHTWVNNSTSNGTVTYVLRPRINNSPDPNCPGGDVTFTVTVRPGPVVTAPGSPAAIVCSDAPIGLSSAINPSNVPITINLLGIDPDAGLTYSGTPALPANFPVNGLALTDLDMHSWTNTGMAGLFVTYEIEYVTADGCTSGPVDYVVQVRAEPVLADDLDAAICSGSATGITLAINSMEGFQTITGFDILSITYDAQALSPGGAYAPAQNAAAGAISGHTWTNLTNGPQSVVYQIAPRRDNGCVGDSVPVTVVVEPEVTFSLTLTHSGLPTGPQTIDVTTNPTPASPLALTICAESAFGVAIASASTPSANADAMVRVFITDPAGLLPMGMAGTTNMPQANLGSFLSFPNGIMNPGTMPSTIEFRIRPYFDTNGNGDYDSGIDCDMGVFGYNLTVESGVFALVNVQPNPGADDEVCSDETFTVRLRKTTASVPVTEYRVWAETGSGLTQTSVAPVSTDAMNPTVFNMPTGSSNQVTFDASFENSLTSNDTVIYHIQPVSATGCIGPEVTQTVIVYGRIMAAPAPLGICIATTGTIASNVTGGGGGYTYTWTYQGGTARQFRINNQTFGNNPVVGTLLNNQTADLSINANVLSGQILITVPGTILMDLLVTDANGCSESFNFEFVIAPQPKSGLIVPNVAAICEDSGPFDLFDLLAIPTYDVGGTWTQITHPGEGQLEPNGVFVPVNISGLQEKTFEFTYTVDNGFCPPASTTVSLKVRPTPKAGQYVGTPANICVGTATFDLNTLIVPGTSEPGGFWGQVLGTTPLGVASNGIVTIPTNVAPGTYRFQYFFFGSEICTNSGSAVVVEFVIDTEANAGEVDPQVSNVFCNSQSTVNLFDLIVNEQLGGTWTRMGANGPMPNPTTGVLNILNFTPGSYAYRYSITATAPCMGADQVDVVVVIDPGLAPNPIVGEMSPCVGSVEVYTVTNINPGSTYTWSLDGGGVITSATTGTSISVLWNNATGGPHTLTLVETNQGCSGTTMLSVNLINTTANFTSAIGSGNGLMINFTDLSSGNPVAWVWDFGDGNISISQNPTHTYAGSGTYNVCLTIVGTCGSDQICIPVTVTEVAFVCDQVALNAGINLISFDVIPANTTVEEIFVNPLGNNLLSIQGRNATGQATLYIPGFPLNTLTNIAPGEGYYVRVLAPASLQVCGTPIDPDFKKNLTAGINLVGYIPIAPSTPATYFGDLIANSNFLSAVGYDPGFQFFVIGNPLNTLNTVRNSRGYEIRVLNATSGTNWLVGSGDEEYQSMTEIAPTNVYDFVAASSDLPASAIGDKVEIIDDGGNVVGYLPVIEGGYLMTNPIYGDDTQYKPAKGIDIGSTLRLRYKGVISDTEITFTGSYQLHYLHVNFGLDPERPKAVIESAKLAPNPFLEQLFVKLDLSKVSRVSIEVVDVNGKLIKVLQAPAELGSGEHTFRWEAWGEPAGIYYVLIRPEGEAVIALPAILQR